MYESSIEHRLLELRQAQASYVGLTGLPLGVGGGAAHHEQASRIHESIIRRLEGDIADDDEPDDDARAMARKRRDDLASDRLTCVRVLRAIGPRGHALVEIVTDERDWSGCESAAFNARFREYRSPLCLAGLAIPSAPVVRHWQSKYTRDVVPNFEMLRSHLLEIVRAHPLDGEHVPILDAALAAALEVWRPVRTEIGRLLGYDVSRAEESATPQDA